MELARFIIALAIALSVMTSTAAQSTDLENVDIDSVVVTASRLLKDIGIQKSVIDTSILKENISLSLADALQQNSVLFIKSYGRATLSTASFRGTAPSHTQVTWNGMNINSPTLGMVDFSLIPSFLVDEASLYHGASSVGITGSGLGGAVMLSTSIDRTDGLSLCYTQGIGSYDTYDQYLRLGYGHGRWHTSTRIIYSLSDNDYRYINRNKVKEPVYDSEGNISGYAHPMDVNKNGDFKDFHLLEELSYDAADGGHFNLSVWWLDSNRGVPMMGVDYRDQSTTRAEQQEHTVRTVASYDKISGSLKYGGKAGYAYSDMLYGYSVDLGTGSSTDAIRSQNYVNTLFASADAEYALGNKLLFSGNVSVTRNSVSGGDSANLTGEHYDNSRTETSTALTVRWRPAERLGLAATLREESYDKSFSSPMAAAFIDLLVWRKANLYLKGSAARNYRQPTLSDLYFQPGGNSSLKPEKGATVDGGVEFTIPAGKRFTAGGELSLYNSVIDNWIMWRPTFKGFWTPLNLERVHSYGLEAKLKGGFSPNESWHTELDGIYTLTRSLYDGTDRTIYSSSGKQLPYIPVHSIALTGRLRWHDWCVTYKWGYYGRRYTTATNSDAISGSVAPYYMNDASIEYRMLFRRLSSTIRLDVRNILDEEYESVLSRPMPGRNYAIYLSLTPHFGNKSR